jgi:lipopolysaccharide/colanic/teichoic acid biosynthesis glycosyltransferase
MYQSSVDCVQFVTRAADSSGRIARRGSGSRAFWAAKRAYDILFSLLALPFVAVIGLLLLLLNPFWNPGPLLFRQTRMGRFGWPMNVVKFRTMLPAGEGSRGPNDPLELHRITPLGKWMRRTRVDELPQLLSVLLGDMSVVGPRPDSYDHAIAYVDMVPNYRRRYAVRPGITGLAQVRMGYAEGFELTTRKTRLDMVYLKRAGWRLEFLIIRRTLLVLATGFGAR